jgi:hypothetical protein
VVTEQVVVTEPHLILLGCSPVVLSLERLQEVVEVEQETLVQVVQAELVAVEQVQLPHLLVQTQLTTDLQVEVGVVEALARGVTVTKEL